MTASLWQGQEEWWRSIQEDRELWEGTGVNSTL